MTASSPEWKDGKCKDITFIVTKDCQLACSYCYLVGKNANERMSWETAKQAVDFILSKEHDELFDFESVVFNFIGGEPFLEIELIDCICDYLKMQMYLLNHHWFNSYRFSITTNGINYDNPKVQEFIRKNIRHLSITITLDGTRQKHDINRVWKGNRKTTDSSQGSYDDVVRNVPLWLKEFPDAATKVTVSSPDLPYVCESVLHLFSLGIHTVHINCVFENVWKEGDDVLLEQQMKSLADTMIAKELYKEYDCSLFDESIGQPMDAKNNRNWCGAGLMLAVDAAGNLYPCTRFVKYSLREKPPRIIGNLDEGIDKNLLRPFYSLSRSIQSTKECIECEVASGCAWCQGENYDCSDSATIFQRSTAICKMHKARVRANNYYWTKINEIERQQASPRKKVDARCTLDKNITVPDTIIVLLATDSTSFCIADSSMKSSLMPFDTLEKVVQQALAHNMHLQFVFPDYQLPEAYLSLVVTVPHKKIVPSTSNLHGDCTVLNGWSETEADSFTDAFCLLRTTLSDFYQNVETLTHLLEQCKRLNIVLTDEETFSKAEEQPYQNTLAKLAQITLNQWQRNKMVDINLITDRLHRSKMSNCHAGWKSVTLAPNGKYYICPSFYYADENLSCGNIDCGMEIKNPLLYHLDHAPLCASCNAYHCQRCVFLNKQKTLEVNIPSYEQCKKSEIELDTTRLFYSLWKETK